VQILTDFRVNQLTLDGNTVTGVEGRHADGTESFLTAPNVILASGDFSASEELKRRYAHEAISKVAAVNPTSTGDGISMGVSIGGCVLNGDLEGDPVLRLAVPKRSLLTSLPPIVPATAALRAILRILPAPVMDRLSSARATVFVPLSSALFDEGAVLVNRRGERFMSERSGHWEAIVEQPGTF
jgi:fumarate reductase flavoprotein subunit